MPPLCSAKACSVHLTNIRQPVCSNFVSPKGQHAAGPVRLCYLPGAETTQL